MKETTIDPVRRDRTWFERRNGCAILRMATATIVGALLAAVVAVACGGPAASDEPLAGSTPVDTPLYIDPHLEAIAAARKDPRFDPIAETPQAKWFTDWSTSDTARQDVGDYLAGAAAAKAVPMLVLYRIPQRDCGRWSSGGAEDEREYKDWIKGVAAALKGHDNAMVVLEPDALPQLGRCKQGDRLGMLKFAVDQLSTTGARVYIDIGNEKWLNADEAAKRLKMVGVNKVAGFSVNVAAHYTTDSEVRYAESVRFELDKLGIPDAHFVVDVGRNGAGPQPDNCNPPDARLGQKPRLYRGGALDGLLWIINPGETDGACRGGPDKGFWAPAALSLLGLEGP
ncbi:cellobiohydrolase A (1,4-beta-cellobiosidase A) [Mycolicibacterium rhodesiae NBB3]|uniref:Glucanase n=1 Tax=Mycolicibacterium rhodesiae (strain NBB3) TaxID=710685 RepID=G8RX49_MYCRN|nr:cellobiohydrolase A (1,4-beta-cellobiosidase A) [Mycolicibacterium rhodesiae NBB3]